MKFLRTPEHRQLLSMLTLARQRAALTPAELADKVTATPGFALKYESGERGPIAGKTARRGRWGWDETTW